jgi:hypothetical protein
MFNGSPFNVRCSDGEDEAEGRCVPRLNCDSATQLEIDGLRCVVPHATGAFVLEELRVDVFKPAYGVDVPSARPYNLTMTPADRFSLLWNRAGDGETNATWLSISEASRKDNAVVFHVKIDPRGLNDSFRLTETITFSSATAAATATAAKNASVRVNVTRLKIDSVVVAVPSLSRSSIKVRVNDRDVQPGAPVEVPQGVKVQLFVNAKDEDG